MPEKEFHIEQLFHVTADNYRIQCNGRNCYEVKGNGLKLGTQASFTTMDGTVLAQLLQTPKTKFKPWKDFRIVKDGKDWALAKQEDWGMASKKEISVDIPGENDYKIAGDRLSWHFEVFRGDARVGTIDKKWGVLDHYGVRVAEGADEVDVLLCGILVDAIYHDGRGARGGAFH